MRTHPHPIATTPLAYIDPGTGMVVVTALGWLFGLVAGIFAMLALFAKRLGRWFRRHRRPLLALVLAAAATLAWWLTQRDRIVVAEGIGRVVVLAFDGLDPRRVERLMAAGRLPHLAALRHRGDYRHLATSNPAQSPVAWAMFATGKNPGHHGVFDFIGRDPVTYLPRLTMAQFANGESQRAVRAPGFWRYAGEAGVPSVILALPANFPPDELNGRALAGMGVPDLTGSDGTFTYFTSATVDADPGGRVVHVRRAPTMALDLYGPNIEAGDRVLPSRVALDVTPLDHRSARVRIAAPVQELVLHVGKWSDWIDLEFDLGWWRHARGIVRMLLQETEPGFRLYVTPVNIDPRDPFYPISVPSNYAAELAAQLGLYYTQGMPHDTWALNEGRLDEKAFVEQARVIHAERIAQLFYELERFRAGIFYAYFEDSDIIQHMFMRYEDPAHPAAPRSVTAPTGRVSGITAAAPHFSAAISDNYTDLIDKWYAYSDAIVGRVSALLGPKDTLLVISDHGFGSFRRAVHVNRWLIEHGYMALHPGSITGSELFADVDWSRTQAYAVGFGGIYLNVAGRESQGSVANDAAVRRALAERIAADLMTWRDGTAPVVRRVWHSSDLYHGPYATAAPDLIIGFHDGYRASWQTALGAAPAAQVEDNRKKWSGDHLIDPALVPGVLFASRPLAATEPSLMDLAPTILAAAGVAPEVIAAADFDGHSLLAP